MEDTVKELKELALQENRRLHPTLPEHARFVRSYNLRTANGLTRAICDYIRLKGGQAERINCTGRPIDNTKVITDVLGDSRRIGSVKWIPTSGQKGTADISATILGRSIKIEIKIGNDRQSEDQKRYQAEIERAGGLYWLIHTWPEFIKHYLDL
jgi:hypothetical protein